jgi:hypothetical protein
LQYNGVPFKLINGVKKDSEYKKIPVLLLNGVQINDSYIIAKNLSPILYGKTMTEEEEAFEYQMTYGLYLCLDSQMLDDGK